MNFINIKEIFKGGFLIVIELMKSFSLQDIIFFIVLLAAATKGVVDFIDWTKKRIRKQFKAEQLKSNQSTHLDSRLNGYDEKIENLNEKIINLAEQIDYLIDNTESLIDSNRDSIKSYITKEHHFFCYEQKWIDDYSLDCLEKRFSHYEKFGGNSFIEDLMKELRELPKIPPQK